MFLSTFTTYKDATVSRRLSGGLVLTLDLTTTIKELGYDPDALTGRELKVLAEELLETIEHELKFLLKKNYPQAKIPDTQQSIEKED